MTDLDTGVSGHFSPKVFSSAADLVKVTDVRGENIHLITGLAFRQWDFRTSCREQQLMPKYSHLVDFH